MDDPASNFQGPLHLLDHLDSCPLHFENALCSAVAHELHVIKSLRCTCRQSSLLKAITDAGKVEDPVRRQAALHRQKILKEHHERVRDKLTRIQRQSQNPGLVSPNKVFAVHLNEEAGVVRCFCRRCEKLFLLFERTLYTGMRKASAETAETWPFRCACGGKSFEVALGFMYAEDALDANELENVAIGVACVACGQFSMVIDEDLS